MLAPLRPVAASSPHLPAWQASVGHDHPLIGRIFRIAGQAPATAFDPLELVHALNGIDFILLGEKHDNPDHHALQAWTIAALARSGRRPAIALEMIGSDQAPALARYLATPDGDAAGLGEAVGWRARGWPDWKIYAPIARAALQADLPIVAADVASETQQQVSRNGIGALPPEMRTRLGLEVGFDAAQAASLAMELRTSHCGHMPEERLPNMMDVQRMRDAHMAHALVSAAALPQVDGAVLIAGIGHVRRDRGVPWQLERMAPGRAVAVVAFIEVDRARRNVDDYDVAGRFDYVWFTPRLDDEDPCLRFFERLRRTPPQ
ncbi:MAG TPA: ChaN family lipoprotein [Alphaproteobacteria bacterium]